ncbi:hypothetical protein JST97_07335 [bacterium]|nr:hypothetical protein [bacterium]
MSKIGLGGLVGGLLGLAIGWAAPPLTKASATLYFPGVNQQLFRKLSEALQADPAGPGATSSPETVTVAKEKLAHLIFTSRAAIQGCLEDRSPAEVERFMANLEVTELASGGLKISVQDRSSESARAKLQALIEYYDSFVAEHPLSPVARTCKQLEEQLDRVAETLRKTEEKLAASSDQRLRVLGDLAIQADPKIMEQLWVRRSEDDETGRAILDVLQNLREADAKGPASKHGWVGHWATGGKIPGKAPRPKSPVRSQDLLGRMRLERNYFDTLLKFRSLLLQRSFLKTLESLESDEYEFIDPPHLDPPSRQQNLLLGGVSGLLLGLLAGWLARRRG